MTFEFLTSHVQPVRKSTIIFPSWNHLAIAPKVLSDRKISDRKIFPRDLLIFVSTARNVTNTHFLSIINVATTIVSDAVKFSLELVGKGAIQFSINENTHNIMISLRNAISKFWKKSSLLF